MDVSQRRDISREFNRQSGSFELALLPMLFGAIGYGLDRWLGLLPLLTLGLGIFGVIGVFTKLWLGYDREMRQHEQEGPWSKAR